MYSGSSSAHVFHSWGKAAIRCRQGRGHRPTRRSSDWKRLSAGAGTKGPRLHDWCYLELADLEVEEMWQRKSRFWTRGLLIRRHMPIVIRFFTTWCQRQHPSEKRWWRSKAIGGRSRTVLRPRKTSSDLDHNESRSWHGWHRTFLGDARLRHDAAISHRANPPPLKKRNRTTANTKAPPRRY